MIKHVLLASAMTIAAPALAQQATAPASSPTTVAAPATPQSVTPATDQATPATTATPDTTQPAQSAAQSVPATPATSDSSAPAQSASASGAGEAKVASVVDTEFANYDKNGDGKLSQAEFSAWMDALKAKSDPSAKPDPAYDRAAFAQADKDKSKTVSKSEITSFLSPKS